MTVGFQYRAYEDCAIILYALNNHSFDTNLDDGEFSFVVGNDRFIFSRHFKSIENCDLKIMLFHTFKEWKEFKEYDKLIQTQTVENYHISNEDIKEYLDAGNICLSSASISFEHSNFYYDPIFNLIFFYHFYGFNFLNYHKFDKKKNLLGVYYKPTAGLNIHKQHREDIYASAKSILKDDFVSYASNDYNLKKILQSYTTFGHWGNNHITSYMDYTTSVCNLIFETLHSDSNEENENDRMYKRQYITEKTLKAICFSEENIFFIWYGPTNLFKYLNNLGFWFLNSEFFVDSIEDSVKKSASYLKSLKEEFKSNNEVHNQLMKLYGEKLKNNVELFNTILNSYSKSNEIINLIKNGKRD
jgi:hypothetical protein